MKRNVYSLCDFVIGDVAKPKADFVADRRCKIVPFTVTSIDDGTNYRVRKAMLHGEGSRGPIAIYAENCEKS